MTGRRIETIDFILEMTRYTCGCTQDHNLGDNTDDLPIGPRRIIVNVRATDRKCLICQTMYDHRRPSDQRCSDGDHDFVLKTDRIRDHVVGTGGWDLCFRCERERCIASKYTTYGMELLALRDVDGKPLFRSPKIQPGGEYWNRDP